MNNHSLTRPKNKLIVVGLSFVIAIFLTMLPLPNWLNLIRPLWIYMLVVYWFLDVPVGMTLGLAWGIGFILDVLYETPLGLYSLALVFVAYILIKFGGRFTFFSQWQKLLAVLILGVIYQIFPFIYANAIGKSVGFWLNFIPSIVSVVLWPFFIAGMRRYKKIFA